MEYYIYKYVINQVPKYIGKTTDLRRRINEHTKDKLANLSNNCDIYYFKCPNKTSMDSWEYFLINKYHPEYNISLKDKTVLLDVKEPEWIKYSFIEHKNNIIIFPKNSVQDEVQDTVILKGRQRIKFYCSHCHSIFITNKWNVTKKGYSAECPECPYSAWVSKSKASSY